MKSFGFVSNSTSNFPAAGKQPLNNDYQAAHEVDFGLFAVQLADGGWSVADGPGSRLCDPGERELAGWHLPVRFETEESAVDAILKGPHQMFDVALDSVWAQHCLAAGAASCDAYRMPYKALQSNS